MKTEFTYSYVIDLQQGDLLNSCISKRTTRLNHYSKYSISKLNFSSYD
ncbi:hypothetical protein Fluta_2400 [Fluviicola taffensis DSM 16823]|uniref:Uncharacterized protein n=1 Tax=Fluviicola taffensis (strain DSM 16823 / NCIMB 13979 / RW262) TaxID=755732 RepID=F2ICZ2_FLUTR|nr:hypothetical protein Fluta_2400 [Fluviicola taffensis DSM 16823]